MLPNVFILGAARSGTNWLCQLLRQVPGCHVPSLKEPNYFARVDEDGWEPHGPFSRARRERILHTHSRRTLEEYTSIYDNKPDADFHVDGSVRYLWSSLAPQRIAQTVPDALMIVLLRDPIERAWSHYLLNRMLGTERLGFIEALDAEEQRVNSGWGFDWRYREVSDYQTCCWHAHVRPEQILIRTYKDFNTNPVTVFNDILAHLGFDSADQIARKIIDASTRIFIHDAPRIFPDLQAYSGIHHYEQPHSDSYQPRFEE